MINSNDYIHKFTGNVLNYPRRALRRSKGTPKPTRRLSVVWTRGMKNWPAHLSEAGFCEFAASGKRRAVEDPTCDGSAVYRSHPVARR